MKKDIKNWLFAIVFLVGAVADLGFDVLSGMVQDLGLSPKVIVWIRLIVIVTGAVKLKLETAVVKK